MRKITVKGYPVEISRRYMAIKAYNAKEERVYKLFLKKYPESFTSKKQALEWVCYWFNQFKGFKYYDGWVDNFNNVINHWDTAGLKIY